MRKHRNGRLAGIIDVSVKYRTGLKNRRPPQTTFLSFICEFGFHFIAIVRLVGILGPIEN